MAHRWGRLGRPAIAFHANRLRFCLGSVCLLVGLLSRLAGSLSAYLRSHDPARPHPKAMPVITHTLAMDEMLGTFKALQQPRKQSRLTVYVAAAVNIGSTAAASAQGGSTDRNGNAMGSQQIPQATTGGATHDNSRATTGMTRPPSQHDPNGSRARLPAKQGPQGDQTNDAPK